MEFVYLLMTLFCAAGGLWFYHMLQAERKNSAAQHRSIINMKREQLRLRSENYALQLDRSELQGMVRRLQPPAKPAAPLPEIFTDEEFKTREQKREADRALGRRLSDRDKAPKPGLDWNDQDRENFNGTGI